jgi:hypothetical protein
LDFPEFPGLWFSRLVLLAGSYSIWRFTMHHDVGNTLLLSIPDLDLTDVLSCYQSVALQKFLETDRFTVACYDDGVYLLIDKPYLDSAAEDYDDLPLAVPLRQLGGQALKHLEIHITAFDTLLDYMDAETDAIQKEGGFTHFAMLSAELQALTKVVSLVQHSFDHWANLERHQVVTIQLQ